MNLLQEIIKSMREMGGTVKLSHLYENLKNKNIHHKYLNLYSFEGSVRATLQSYWKKGKRFNGIEKFERVEHGLWSLKDYKVDIARVANPEPIRIFIDSKDDELFAISDTKVYFRSADQGIYPGIMVGERKLVKIHIDFEGYMDLYFIDQKNREWQLGFNLNNNFLIEIFSLLEIDYIVSK